MLIRHSLSDALTERLLALIRTEGLKPGDRLPSSRTLAARFAVATPTVREALRRLQATGAVEFKHGSGVYISQSLDRVVMANPHMPTLATEQLSQLLEARLLVEPYLAAHAARRNDVNERKRLRSALRKAERNIGNDDETLHEANMEFHRAVAAASGNTVLHEVIDSLLSVHAGEQREIQRIFDDRVRDHEEHRAVLAAIEAGDPDRASELMRRHLEDVRDVVTTKQIDER
ncbi:FadR/GntR family transcriptional regulator [Allorhizocola rhizosphaerae]|uniref:FadR/GntR family transcriptional regulator n=1 Tax=Allorhizocola rhizosphaerae TaxID=1872709 RepID=UPI000E3BE0FA|nr:FadR/GntR family transcriptional regulator [Allorhizocola rhizosphaerae]